MKMINTQENITYKRTKRSALCQQVLQDCKEQTIQYDRQTQNTNNKKDHTKNSALELSVRKVLEVLNMFDSTNLNLIQMWIKTNRCFV